MNLSAELDRWLSPETRELLVRIGACATCLGYHAYLVGGPVRDLLLGRPSCDLDVVVEGDAPAVACAATTPDQSTPVVHSAFGTATIQMDVSRIDLATARAESYERPGALPTVYPGTIEQDLVRRDFTVNAMALTLDGRCRGELLDLHGGRSDLDHGFLRVLHESSFIDDATRILRGVRYEQRFGFVFEKRTLELLERDLRYMNCISADRVRHEFERTFEEEEPEQTLRRLDVLGVLGVIHPTLLFHSQKSWALASARRSARSPTELHNVYWCLLAWGVSADDVETLGERLNLARGAREALADSCELALLEARLDDPGLAPSEVFDLLHRRSHAALQAAELMFVRPTARGHISHFVRRLRHVRPSLTGKDLQALGVPEGPLMGRILSSLRSACLNGEVASREDEVALVRRLVNPVSWPLE